MRNGRLRTPNLTGRRPAHRPPATVGVAAAAVIALAVGAAACSGGATPGAASAPAPTITPGTTTPVATPAPTPRATPTTSPAPESPATPPTATIAGLAGGGTAAGDLGSFTWDGMASDGPWIVERTGSGARAGARLLVTFALDAGPSSWSAAWAPVHGRSAGTPVGAGRGHAAVAVRAPRTAGAWSLRLTASFGDGRTATWFWRLAVDP